MTIWDLAIVGAGPAGSATALGALRTDPTLRVVLLDRATFPRDKSCGDGIAPHVIDLLEAAGVHGVTDGHVPVPRLRLDRGRCGVDGLLQRPTWVIPRVTFDRHLVDAAQAAGATLLRHRVRTLTPGRPVVLDAEVVARTVVGADGAHSVVRRSLGLPAGPTAIAIRGYAPTPEHRAGAQVIAYDAARQPAYAWAFDIGDGRSNVGYGVLPGRRREQLTRAELLGRLDALLPGAGDGATAWKGAPLPLSSGRWRSGAGPVLLTGDAAGLVNPMTGEGIYYAVATGLAAGRAAARAVRAGEPESSGARYAATMRPLLSRHLRDVAVAARLSRYGSVVDAGLRASAADQRVFDDLVELGLARGRLTAPMLRGLVRELAPRRRRPPSRPGGAHRPGTPVPAATRRAPHPEETPTCGS
jgi:geranylgeranyl reductase family protein